MQSDVLNAQSSPWLVFFGGTRGRRLLAHLSPVAASRSAAGVGSAALRLGAAAVCPHFSALSRIMLVGDFNKKTTRKLLKTEKSARHARSALRQPAVQPALQASGLRAIRVQRTVSFRFQEFASHEEVPIDLATLSGQG